VLASVISDELLPDPDSAWSSDGWRLGGSQGVRFLAREQDGTEHALRAMVADGQLTLEMDGTARTLTPPHAMLMNAGNEWQAQVAGIAYNFTLTGAHAPKAGRVADAATHPLSPMPGRVVAVHVKTGDRVEPGQALMVLEGMKMEYTVKAAVAGTVEKVMATEGSMVDAEAPLAHIKPDT